MVSSVLRVFCTVPRRLIAYLARIFAPLLAARPSPVSLPTALRVLCKLALSVNVILSSLSTRAVWRLPQRRMSSRMAVSRGRAVLRDVLQHRMKKGASWKVKTGVCLRGSVRTWVGKKP